MHANEVIWHKENGGNAWETLHRRCIKKKAIRKEVTTGRAVDVFWILRMTTYFDG